MVTINILMSDATGRVVFDGKMMMGMGALFWLWICGGWMNDERCTMLRIGKAGKSGKSGK